MVDDDSAIAVLTRESVGEVLAANGVGGLSLQPRHARRQRYVVCMRNDRNTNPDAGEPHGTALIVATIAGVEVSGEIDGVPRWRLMFGAVARVSIPDVWKGWRNPVIYKRLSDLGINPAELSFSQRERDQSDDVAPTASGQIAPLTISQAKAGLAKGLGVRVDQIEILIRG